MNVWVLVNTVRKLVTSALAAFLCWIAITNSPLWPRAAAAAHDNAATAAKADDHPSTDKAPGDHGAAAHKPEATEHVMDSNEWELFMSFGPPSWHLPKLFGFQITKYMVLELIAGILIIAIYVPLANKVRAGGVTRGAYGNFFEVLLTFIRDQVAKPSIGEHDADKYVPFLWTMFLFILFNNLLGMFPFGGSATASIYVTAGLALVVFGYMHGSGIAKMGFGKYIMSLWPHIDAPFGLGYVITPLIFLLEWLGVLVRNLVLAVRLFANMFAGHMVLATLLIFIWVAKGVHPAMWAGITISSVLGIVALSLLELFVAFLQAFVFTFLTALFMGMALHPEH